MMAEFDNARVQASGRNRGLMNGIVFGLIGGLAGTLVIDVFAIGTLLALGYPAELYFYIIGNTTAGFFTGIGISLTGSFALGGLVHYLIGLAFGVTFGIAVSQVQTLHIDPGKAILLGILYVEVVSQPLLAAAPIVTKAWSISMTWEWFVSSFYIHLIYSVVLGLVVVYGLRFAVGAWSGRFSRTIRLPSTQSTA